MGVSFLGDPQNVLLFVFCLPVKPPNKWYLLQNKPSDPYFGDDDLTTTSGHSDLGSQCPAKDRDRGSLFFPTTRQPHLCRQ